MNGLCDDHCQIEPCKFCEEIDLFWEQQFKETSKVKFKRKNQLIEAMQLTDKNRAEVLKWMGTSAGDVIEKKWDPVNIHLKTIEEPIEGQILIPFDYVIKHEGVGFSVVPRESFEMDYERSGP